MVRSRLGFVIVIVLGIAALAACSKQAPTPTSRVLPSPTPTTTLATTRPPLRGIPPPPGEPAPSPTQKTTTVGVEKPISTPTSTVPQKQQKVGVLIYVDPIGSNFTSTKLSALLFQHDLKHTVVGSEEDAVTELQKGDYKGVWVYAENASDNFLFKLRKFADDGGRIFFEINADEMCKPPYYKVEFPQYLGANFGVTYACDQVLARSYRLPKGVLPVVGETQMGNPSNSIDGYLTVRPGEYQVFTMKSLSGVERIISAWKKVGSGDVILLVSNTTSLISDKIIDSYENKDGILKIIRWLIGGSLAKMGN